MTTTAPAPPTKLAPRPPAADAPRDQRARHDQVLFERLAAGADATAREALVERYLPLARSLALRYQRSAEPLDDLMQVASLGLVKAIDGFDCNREIAFSSYAVPTILGEIKRHFRDRTWAVRVPRGLQEMSARVDRAVAELAENMHRQPSVAEIAVQLGADEEDVLEALQAGNAYRSVSFETPRGAGGGTRRRRSRTPSASTSPASTAPSIVRRWRRCSRRSARASARCCACASKRT